MDQMRLIIALVLSFVVFLGWNFFFGQEAKQPPASPPQQAAKPEKISAARNRGEHRCSQTCGRGQRSGSQRG